MSVYQTKLLRNHTILTSGVDLDDLTAPGDYALSDPDNAPGNNDYLVVVRKILGAAVYESGSIVFSSVADNGDTVTIDDGVAAAPTVFTFAASGDAAVGAAVDVATGASAEDSATNLRAAIAANTNINVTAGGATTTVSVTNAATPYGGAITKSDGDDDYAVTDFTGGDDGLRVVQESVDLSDGSRQTRVYDGAGSWGSWA
jgi:hypothetical protein